MCIYLNLQSHATTTIHFTLLWQCIALFLHPLGTLLTKLWGTSLLADASMYGFMVTVQVPEGVIPGAKKPPFTDNDAETLQDILHHDFKVEVCEVALSCRTKHC